MMKPTRSWTTGFGLTVATLLLSSLLVSCGSSKKYDEFIPTRIVSAGDGMSYLGVAAGGYVNPLTVTEETPNVNGVYDHWLKQFANGYWAPTLGNSANTTANVIMLRTIAPVVARHGDVPAPSDAKLADIKAQFTQAQTAGFIPRSDDLLVMSVGLGDIIELAETYLAGGVSVDSLKSEAKNRGEKYMAYADSLYQSGVFKRIILINPIDISNSPYAQKAKAGSALNPAVDTVISQITDQFTYGLKTNPPTYPRDGGVWLFDATNLMLNINVASTLNVNLTVPVCDEEATPRNQTCSVKENVIKNDLLLGNRTTYTPTPVTGSKNPNSLLNPNLADPTNAVLALTTTNADIVTTSLATTKYATTHYFYAGSILPTPLVHQYMGSTLYNRMRSAIGF